MMTALKICGLQPGDDMSFTVHGSVRHVGIMFVPASKRYVAPTAARTIVAELNERACTAIGVFVDADERAIVETVQSAQVTGVQLHGQETPQFCQSLRDRKIPVWKAISVPNAANGDVVATAEALFGTIAPYLPHVDGLLLDATPPARAAGVTGGHGKAFNWLLLPHIVPALQRTSTVPVWIAGGITANNVGALLTLCRPEGIDVSSGVERNGRKSSDLIDQFVKVVASHG